MRIAHDQPCTPLPLLYLPLTPDLHGPRVPQESVYWPSAQSYAALMTYNRPPQKYDYTCQLTN